MIEKTETNTRVNFTDLDLQVDKLKKLCLDPLFAVIMDKQQQKEFK